MISYLACRCLLFDLNRHVLPIVLLVNGSAVFAQVIHAPRLIEGNSLLVGERMAELCCGRLQGRESGFQFRSDFKSIDWPVAGYCVEAGKSVKDSTPKLGIGRTPGGESLEGKCPKNADQGANHCKRPDRNIAEKLTDIAHAFLYGVLIAVIPLIPVFLVQKRKRSDFKTPNV